jgi:hypothetical protein
MSSPEEIEKLKQIAAESPRLSEHDAGKLSPTHFHQWQLSVRRRKLTTIAWMIAVFVAAVSRGSNWDQICMGLSAGGAYYVIARWITNQTIPSLSYPRNQMRRDWAFYFLIILACGFVVAYAKGWVFFNAFAGPAEQS